ncbi:hypothetical protein AOZ06_39145 [Kibdelosporangium phytohabitans]|uniref:Uncharacterized protein n=1 Tax=Kibdelosporangium phytohabitans TaxID=860235 RepID=A0A0N9IBL6_9PSEU|nr:hypothetical protein AOZ06_39145 [Kibdelosporangium phytohabitans]
MATIPEGSANAWAFGVRRDGSTYAMRSIGEFADQWAPVDVPDVGRVHALRHVWAAAEKGSLRWADGKWLRVPVPGRPVLRAIETDPVVENTAWAVGAEQTSTSRQRGAVRKWDGTHWRVVPVPPALVDDSSELTGALVSTDGVFVYGIDHDRHRGGRVIALRFDGTSWSALPAPPPRPGYEEHVTSHDSSASRLVGWTAPVGASPQLRVPLIYHVDSTTGLLTKEDIPRVAGWLTAVTTEYGTPLVVGSTASQRPLAMHLRYDGEGRTSWTVDEMPDIRNGQLLAVGGTIVPNIWAVGSTRGHHGERPLMLRYSP